MSLTADTEILWAMRRAGEGGVSGADLAQRLGISRAAVWSHIEDLRSLGYEIQASPHQGYRLVAAPDVLHADDLLACLGRSTRIIGRDIRVFQETTSTNDVCEKLARDGVKEGVVVFAESQRKGRGRLGRTWFSPPRKGLWFSVLLRPLLPPQAATQLVVAASVALTRAIHSQCDLTPSIKWPNDILIRGRKVGGILTELSAELDHIRHVVLGVGLDVNLEAQDFPAAVRETATSLRIESGQALDRAALATEVLQALDLDYGRVCAGQFAQVADEWERQCATLGRQVGIRIGDRLIRGRAEALDDDGALLIRTEHGRLERVVGGDVALEKPAGGAETAQAPRDPRKRVGTSRTDPKGG
jgi:BirA family transcriptional regulator, biotin operon repressor / biotin---[acetyl-CoA-carboxylase] ligase